MGTPQHLGRRGKVARRDRAPDAGAANGGAASPRLGNGVDLQPTAAAPGANAREGPLTTLAEGRFGREDEAARPTPSNEASKEILPGGLPHRCVKGELEKTVDPRVGEAKGQLDIVEETGRQAAAEQQVGVRIKADVQSLQP